MPHRARPLTISPEMTRAQFLRRARTAGSSRSAVCRCSLPWVVNWRGPAPRTEGAGTLRACTDADWKNADPGDVYSTPDGCRTVS